LLYNGPLLCGFNVPIKGLSNKFLVVRTIIISAVMVMPTNVGAVFYCSVQSGCQRNTGSDFLRSKA